MQEMGFDNNVSENGKQHLHTYAGKHSLHQETGNISEYQDAGKWDMSNMSENSVSRKVVDSTCM